MRLRPDSLALKPIPVLDEVDFGDPGNRVLLGADPTFMPSGYDKFAVGLAEDMEPYLSGRWRSYFERNTSSPDWLPWVEGKHRWTSESFLEQRLKLASTKIQLDRRFRIVVVRPASFTRESRKGSTDDVRGR